MFTLSPSTSLDISSQDCYDIPRTFPNDRSSSLEGFHNHFVSMIWSHVGLGNGKALAQSLFPFTKQWCGVMHLKINYTEYMMLKD